MNLRISGLLLLTVLLAAGFSSCKEKNRYPDPGDQPVIVQQPHTSIDQMQQTIREGEQLLRDGDLVVRAGREPVSRIIRTFNRKDASYSHAGLVFFENGRPWVYHILPAEDSLKPEKIRRDSMLVFCDPYINDGFGIFRYKLDSVQTEKLRSIIQANYQKGILFDDRFDMRTDNKMYCSEMIAKALETATGKTIRVETVQTTPAEASFFANRLHATVKEVMERRIVPIDNLYLMPHCKPVNRFKFDSLTVR